MANVCGYHVTAEGPMATLQAIIGFLTPAIVPCPGGFYSPNILELGRLWSDLGKGDHDWIGVGRYGAEPGDCFEVTEGKLSFEGACKWAPPAGFLRRLSERFVDVLFRCKATTEHEVYDHFVYIAGQESIVDHSVSDIQAGRTIWYWRDGEKLTPSEEVDEPDDRDIPECPYTYEA